MRAALFGAAATITAALAAATSAFAADTAPAAGKLEDQIAVPFSGYVSSAQRLGLTNGV